MNLHNQENVLFLKWIYTFLYFHSEKYANSIEIKGVGDLGMYMKGV